MSSTTQLSDPEELVRLKQLRDVLKKAATHKRYNRWRFFEPFQKQIEFFDLGQSCDERLFFAGNQLGKTEAGGFEAACHVTGLYPDDWLGRRISHSNRGWVGGETSTLVRDGAQKKLLGTPGVLEDFGTGYIPKHLIVDVSLARGVTDAFDTVQARHVDGGISTIVFKSYEQGRQKWQTDTVDWVWFDEEPPEDIYSEGLARYTATHGFSWMTFTPLHGMSGVVMKFLDEQEVGTSRGHIVMGLDDRPDFTPEQRAAILAKYPEHERDARAKGLPMLGSGRVFTVLPEALYDEPREYISPQWVKLWGIDFGIDHPFAGVLTAWDRDTDVFYILDAFKLKNQSHREHAARMKPIGIEVPVAWPSDGNSRQKDGVIVKNLYKGEGLTMLSEHAQFSNKSVSVEAGIMQMEAAMRAGQFKVARHLQEWFAEFGLYHRRDGKIVKEHDDLMDATRYAWMMRRFAQAVPLGGEKRKGGARGPDEGMCRDWDFDVFAA